VAAIVWTDEAQRWLRDIHDYIAADNPGAADRTVSAIHERAEILLTFPQAGQCYRTDRDVRILLYGHYRIAYATPINRRVAPRLLATLHPPT
jgi:plasmid stabilization system protein ParE